MGISGIGNYYQSDRYLYNPGSKPVVGAGTESTKTAEKPEDVLSTGKPTEQVGNSGAANRAVSDGSATWRPSVPLSISKAFFPAEQADGELSPEEIVNPDAHKKAGRKSSPEECQTCKERKYQDGSDENVSFKSAAHISPEAAGAAVRAHEGEHVSNAYKEAAEKGGEVVNASVTIHTSICPECGRTYVSGGTTSTTIRYSSEENKNPYEKAKKAQEAIQMRGKNIDYAA